MNLKSYLRAWAVWWVVIFTPLMFLGALLAISEVFIRSEWPIVVWVAIWWFPYAPPIFTVLTAVALIATLVAAVLAAAWVSGETLVLYLRAPNEEKELLARVAEIGRMLTWYENPIRWIRVLAGKAFATARHV